ncbi:MAG: hypothetical protein ACC660_03550, partial [Acidimicrobiales bacterium]
MREHLTPALWSIGAAVVWVVLGFNNPTLTYHFAPVIAAGAWPSVLQARDSRSLWAAGAGGLGIALVATVVLALGDSLRGPDLAGGSAATAESIIFAFGGAALAGRGGRLRHEFR